MADRKTKQPHEVLDYDFDGLRKLDDTDTIRQATITIEGPDNALLQPKPVTWSDVRVKVWLAAGTSGASYKITALVETVGGRIHEREFILLVKEK